MELDSKLKEEIELAKKVRKNAYVPYSNFKVGAVLKTKKGKTYTGCNIENNGIQSICAERVAFCKALSEGEKEFESIFSFKLFCFIFPFLLLLYFYQFSSNL